MKALFKPLLLSVVLASAGVVVQAQNTAPAAYAAMHAKAGHGRWDPAKMQEHIAKRQSELKEKLNLSPAQEPAWSQYTAAMQPPAGMAQRMDRAERQKRHAEMLAMTTPERIDRMQALQVQRQARTQQRGNAVKAFYAALDLDQQRVFDAESMKGRQRHQRHGGHGQGRQPG